MSEQTTDLLRRVADLAQAQRDDLKLLDTHLALLTRRMFLAAILGYVLFALVCAGGAYLYVRTVSAEKERRLAAAQAELRRLKQRVQRVEQDRKKQVERKSLGRKAVLRYFQAFASGKVKQALELEDRARERASGAFEQAVVDYVAARLHDRAARGALAKGLFAMQSGKLKKAVHLFRQAATYAGNSALAVQAHYYAGLTYYKLGEFAEAAKHLGMVATSKGGEDILDDTALFRLGHAHDMLKHTAAAARYYRLLLEKYPKSPLAAVAKAKLKKLPSGT